MSNFNPYDHFGFLTNRVARLIIKSVEPRMHADGHRFPVSCIGILAELWSTDGVSQNHLAKALIKNKSSITKMLCALEREGLVRREDDPTDGRGKLIFLTDRGRQMQAIIEEKSRMMENELLNGCSKEDISVAKKVMAEMYEKLYMEINQEYPNHKTLIEGKTNN